MATKASYTIVVLGDDGVGKTSLLMTYCTNEFPHAEAPPVFGVRIVTIGTPEGKVDLVLKDTVGQADAISARRLSYTGADAFILCFSVSSPSSFLDLTKWADDLKNFNQEVSKNIPVILVGTQIDLRTNEQQSKLITTEEGLAKAKEIEAFSYVECSAKEKTNLSRVFSDTLSVAICVKKADAEEAKGNETCLIC